MDIDEKERFLATGDVNGLVKVWNIQSYCFSSALEADIINTEPPLISSIKSHSDQINSINFCTKHNKTYVILASSDCSVSLNDLNGNLIGTFGQDSHWKLESPTTSLRSTPNKMKIASDAKLAASVTFGLPRIDLSHVEEKITQNDDLIESNSQISLSSNRFDIEETFKYDANELIKDTSIRYNPWSKTLLGKSYQEIKTKKRGRRQPSLITNGEYEIWNKTGQVPGGLYGSLKMVELENVETKKKFESKFFRERNAPNLFENKSLEKSLAESLRCAFDEKSLFPKYILDYEARMRQEHKNIINRVNKENEIVRFGIGKRNGSSLSMTNS